VQVQAQATARNSKLTTLAQQAGQPLSKDEIKAQQADLVQKVLYEQDLDFAIAPPPIIYATANASA
jgi:hypothetical protein